MRQRLATIQRESKETRIRVVLDIDGSGLSTIHTGIGMLDHLLEQIARHGLMDLTIEAEGDLAVDPHHTVEDIGICLGRALDKSLGDRAGIVRMGHALVPLDEALALVAIDIGGRGHARVDAEFTSASIGELPADMVSHFLETFAREARMTLHVRLLSGANDHHRAEAIFKGLAKALREACQLDPRTEGSIPSTKGLID